MKEFNLSVTMKINVDMEKLSASNGDLPSAINQNNAILSDCLLTIIDVETGEEVAGNLDITNRVIDMLLGKA